MPVPGQPRNPFGQTPDRFMLEDPRPVGYSGDVENGFPIASTLSQRSLRGMVLAAGQIRELWKQAVNYIPAADDYSWTANGPITTLGRMTAARGFQLTRALRYMTRSVYFAAGTDNTRYVGMHSAVQPRVRHKTPTVNAGQQRGKPVTRNRLTSFGSRVTPMQDRRNGGTL